jgi:hypothetical protein
MLIISNTTYPSPPSENVTTFSIPVLSETADFLYLLEYPPYLAVAMENNGIIIKKYSKITINDEHSLDLMGITISYINRSDSLFFYQINYGWDKLYNNFFQKILLEIDTSDPDQWVIRLSIPALFMKILPNDFYNKLKMKAQTIASLDNQKQMINYFNKINSTQEQANEPSKMLEAILINGYNLCSLDKNRDVSDTVPNVNLLLLFIIIMSCLVAINIYALRKTP